MSHPEAFHIVLIGRVQGVGFRYFIRQKANELKLKGWVKNKADGSVELEVEGNSDSITIFLDMINIGNSMSRIDRIFKSELPSLQGFDSFFVKY